jgi:hypothetical protein
MLQFLIDELGIFFSVLVNDFGSFLIVLKLLKNVYL